MLFNDKLLFLHVPKTGGVSIEQFLIHTLPGRITVTDELRPTNAWKRLPTSVRLRLRLKTLLKRWGMWLPQRVIVVEGKRHQRMQQARDTLAGLGRRLEDFHAVLAVVRNPYDLEVSRYHFLRLGYHGVKGLARAREQKIAMEEDFETFACKAPYHGRLPAQIEEWYELDGRLPENLRILRFENLESDLHRAVGELYPVTARLPRLNASEHAPYTAYLTPNAEEVIYRKYHWLFERGFYVRESMKLEPLCGTSVQPPWQQKETGLG
jgi:hypothetical protein